LNTCGAQAAVACERVRREQQERAQLEAASRARQLAVAGQLAVAMAHEVSNPLTAIRSSVQYVMKTNHTSLRSSAGMTENQLTVGWFDRRSLFASDHMLDQRKIAAGVETGSWTGPASLDRQLD
jgi:signal transduction histidine kinase